jgi:signal transduction histidine kinase
MKTIQGKINFGVIFLFLVIIIIGLIGIFFINQLAQRSKGTITENYNSIDYMMNMLTAIDDMSAFQTENIRNSNSADSIALNSYSNSRRIFERNLNLETKNITEPGEGEIVDNLHAEYQQYMSLYESLFRNPSTTEKDLEIFQGHYLQIRSKITDTYKINFDAINRNNTRTQNIADNTIQYMSIIVTISILVTFFFIFSFSSRITGPVKELTRKIKSISEKNYDQKLEINSNDEFGELASAFNAMAERLKIYETKHIDEILFEKKRMESLVANLEDGVLLIDENRKTVVANNTILQITGLKDDDIINSNISDVALQNDLFREIINGATKIKSGNADEQKPLRIVLAGRENFYKLESEDIITFSESSKQETFIGTLILLRNITSFHERDTAKTNLLATVSHELKTPLSSINLSLKLLNDSRVGSLNSEQTEIIGSLRQQSSRLSKVINEVLDYSQIETGNIKLRTASIKPEDIIDLSATALMMQMSEKNIQLDTNIEESLPPVKADLEKTVWVLINLLNNAIRYSRQDGVIKLNVIRESGEVVFSVKDSGPGISKEDQDKIFQRFSQVGNKSKSGWGLGLAIAKEFVQAQGGRIWVESEEGTGSQFFFSLPGNEIL